MNKSPKYEKELAMLFILGPVIALVGLIYLLAYVDADFVPGGRGLF